MSIRTVIEINHGGHVSTDLLRLLSSSGNMDHLNDDRTRPQGIRFLGQRHHSTELTLVVR
jgi:hypothetical protein